MRPRRVMTPEDTTFLFDEAVRERSLAAITVQADEDWRSFKSRFLERDPNRQFFVLDYQSVTPQPLPEVWVGQCVGVSFRHRNRKVLFATVVEARGHFVLDDRSSVPAIRYRWPESLTELQRRAYYRTLVPPSLRLLATMWKGGAAARKAAQGSTLHLVTGSLADFSCGGALVRLDGSSPPPWSDNETLGIELHLADGKPPVVLNAFARGVRHTGEGQFCVALQFVGLEISADGRGVLERLAGSVQRLHRMGFGGGPAWNRRNEEGI